MGISVFLIGYTAVTDLSLVAIKWYEIITGLGSPEFGGRKFD